MSLKRSLLSRSWRNKANYHLSKSDEMDNQWTHPKVDYQVKISTDKSHHAYSHKHLHPTNHAMVYTNR